jgi:hypothetical protein
MRIDVWLTARRAVLEFLVIALGVFAGLAADNWNEARRERALEREYLGGIALDLREDIEEVERIEASAAQLEGAVLRVIEGIRTGQSQWSTPEEMARDLVFCTYLGLPRLSSITWDELRGTGSLRLLRDTGFKRRLADYYRRFDYHGQFHAEYRRKEAAVEEALLGFLPLEVRNQMSDADRVTHADIDIQAALLRMQQAPGLLERLEDIAWVQHRVVVRYGWVKQESEAMLALIEAGG